MFYLVLSAGDLGPWDEQTRKGNPCERRGKGQGSGDRGQVRGVGPLYLAPLVRCTSSPLLFATWLFTHLASFVRSSQIHNKTQARKSEEQARPDLSLITLLQ